MIENGPIVEVAQWTILSDCAKSVSSRSPYTSGHFARRGGLTKWGAGPVRHSRSPEIRQGGVAPDQRLPRWATHSCSAPPTGAIRSKSAS